jgi:light-regulated signal transduction histidine kinase (bacteriophytochrome)
MLKQKLEERVAERTAELEASKEQLKVLVRKMQHRCKNLLAVVQSLATNTLSRAANVEEASKALLGRLADWISARMLALPKAPIHPVWGCAVMGTPTSVEKLPAHWRQCADQARRAADQETDPTEVGPFRRTARRRD